MKKPRTLAEIETEAVENALKANGGDVTAAAAQLGVTRATLYKKFRAAGIDIEQIRKDAQR